MSSQKVVRAAKNLIFNPFMTKEAISSASFRPPAAIEIVEEEAKPNIRLHDETTHLKFGFPMTDKSKKMAPSSDSN
ncbi:unnamed protein product [Caenorhabditis bovis]|uniref:Uncharacterized protein n=1 Tax=Caenorhabditis bovis TaxID=2654633 RepID=A0A8S1F972_9PELO|nr:unnamed protein product [Caenorhabditis bovis]